MKVKNTFENLVYDDEDPRCFIEIVQGPNSLIAFIQALDIGNKGTRHRNPIIKRLWGVWNPIEPQISIQEILAYGVKWPDLPCLEDFAKFEARPYKLDSETIQPSK